MTKPITATLSPDTSPDQSEAPSPNAHRDMWYAFARLMTGEPTDKWLVQAHAHNKMKVTQSTVAAESGRSRNLITGDDCAFPDLRDAINSVKAMKGVSVKTTERLASQAEHIRFLEQAIRQRDSLHADRLLAMEEVADRLLEAKKMGEGKKRA